MPARVVVTPLTPHQRRVLGMDPAPEAPVRESAPPPPEPERTGPRVAARPLAEPHAQRMARSTERLRHLDLEREARDLRDAAARELIAAVAARREAEEETAAAEHRAEERWRERSGAWQAQITYLQARNEALEESLATERVTRVKERGESHQRVADAVAERDEARQATARAVAEAVAGAGQEREHALAQVRAAALREQQARERTWQAKLDAAVEGATAETRLQLEEAERQRDVSDCRRQRAETAAADVDAQLRARDARWRELQDVAVHDATADLRNDLAAEQWAHEQTKRDLAAAREQLSFQREQARADISRLMRDHSETERDFRVETDDLHNRLAETATALVAAKDELRAVKQSRRADLQSHAANVRTAVLEATRPLHETIERLTAAEQERVRAVATVEQRATNDLRAQKTDWQARLATAVAEAEGNAQALHDAAQAMVGEAREARREARQEAERTAAALRARDARWQEDVAEAVARETATLRYDVTAHEAAEARAVRAEQELRALKRDQDAGRASAAEEAVAPLRAEIATLTERLTRAERLVKRAGNRKPITPSGGRRHRSAP